MRAATLILCCSLALAACGSPRAEPPELDVTAGPGNFVPYTQEGGDVSFNRPDEWALEPRDPPGVATVATGGASATFWAYRSAAVVTDAASAGKALKGFLASLAQRDPGFAVGASAVTVVSGKPAFEVRGTTEVEGRATGARSIHAFNGTGEYVLDMLADPDKFAEVNRTVFRPLVASWSFLGNPPAYDEGTAVTTSPTAQP